MNFYTRFSQECLLNRFSLNLFIYTWFITLKLHTNNYSSKTEINSYYFEDLSIKWLLLPFPTLIVFVGKCILRLTPTMIVRIILQRHYLSIEYNLIELFSKFLQKCIFPFRYLGVQLLFKFQLDYRDQKVESCWLIVYSSIFLNYFRLLEPANPTSL